MSSTASELDSIHPIWLITGIVVFPFMVYQLLGFLSPLIHNLTAMRISEIYVYPIKSLRAVQLNEAVATKYGFQHDRTFLLLKAKPDGTYENMAVSRMPEMTQFLQEFENYGTNDAAINVTYRAYGDAEKAKTIQIPLLPDTESLEPYQVTMHSSPAPAFLMPAEYSSWFSSCFGYDVILVYLGDNRRPVMFEDMQPLEPDPLTLFLKKHVPIVGEYVDRLVGPRQTEQWRLTFADCAPYLITSKTSLDDLSSRMPAGEEVDMRKFRPNIVIEGANEPWQEDYWGKVTINQKTDIIMAHNCVRCTSVNLDYDTGKPATGAAGEVLKRMQKDRRIDIGAKWSPVFGRYSFWDPKRPSQTIKVGDKVNVTKVNEGLTVWSWPGLS
jgi:uncharacterized protein YcbX